MPESLGIWRIDSARSALALALWCASNNLEKFQTEICKVLTISPASIALAFKLSLEEKFRKNTRWIVAAKTETLIAPKLKQ